MTNPDKDYVKKKKELVFLFCLCVKEKKEEEKCKTDGRNEERGKMRNSRTPGMAPPGTDFIIVYMPSPPELDESG